MMEKISEEALAAYDDLAAELEPAGVTRGQSFGMPCLKVGRKMVAGMFGNAMAFKLPPGVLEEALAVPGAGPFDPAGGRPMKEWVLIPLEQSAVWAEYGADALEYVRG
ncbi:hypothetical protein ACFTSF_24985 [Kribbella sp. NPDC056951]|uniref:hypothetical protein n=1 Tax=Kribbella sp. NPDC056951 TaxID=3345978 RepID=UPI00363184D5